MIENLQEMNTNSVQLGNFQLRVASVGSSRIYLNIKQVNKFEPVST